MSQRILSIACVASLASISWAASVNEGASVQASVKALADLGISVMSQSDYAMSNYRDLSASFQPTVVSRRSGRRANATHKPHNPMDKYKQYGNIIGMVMVPNPALKKKPSMSSPCQAAPDGVKEIKDTVLAPCQDFDKKQPGAPVSMFSQLKFYCGEGDQEKFGLGSDKGMEQLQNVAEIYGLVDAPAAASAALLELEGAIVRRGDRRNKRGDKKEICSKIFLSATGGAYSGWEVKDGKGQYVKAGGGGGKPTVAAVSSAAEPAKEEGKAPAFRAMHHTGVKQDKPAAPDRDHYFDNLFFDDLN